MKVAHMQPNKRKIKGLPVTGNYLIPEDEGTYRWAEPNDSWSIFAHTGQQRCLISNIRYDDTEHSPDLWIYTILKNDEMRLLKTVNNRIVGKEPKPHILSTLAENNRLYLDRSRKWYIRQFMPNTDRTGVQRFAGLPFNAWRAMWRKNIPLDDISIYGMSGNNMKIIYGGLKFNAFLRWPELQEDVGNSSSILSQRGVSWYVSTTVMPWMKQHCRGGFYPFSDYDVMMPDDSDEVIYNIDIGGIS